MKPVLVPAWLAWVAVVIALGLWGNTALAVTVLLCLHGLLLSTLLLAMRSAAALVLVAAFWLRLVVLALDLSGSWELFGSGHDADAFYRAATSIQANPALIGSDIYGGVYSKLAGALFVLTGPSLALVQYTNVFLYICGAVLISGSMQRLGVRRVVAGWALAICCFLPIPALLSSLFLRESLIFFLVAASIYGFCGWLQRGRAHDVFIAVGALFAAGTLHVGVLGLLAGFALAGWAYSPNRPDLSPRLKGTGPWVALLGVMVVFALRFPELVLGKVATIDSAAELFERASASAGESAYLPGVQIETTGDFLRWGGVKAVLLLLAPTPLHWRGVSDVVAFVSDASFHAAVPLFLLVWLRRIPNGVRRQQVIVLFIAWLSAVVVFGAGTANAGTAMRHRQKLLPAAVVACALAFPVSRNRDDAPQGDHASTGEDAGQRPVELVLKDEPDTWMPRTRR